LKKYDIVVFGATGFTGELICDYLLGHEESKGLNIAVAARDKEKLEKVVSRFSSNSPDMLVVDSFDKESIDSMTSLAKLIITVVGPYSLYGEYLVESCTKNSTHYVDLTGEPNFVHTIRKKYSEAAINSKSIIVNSCGLESIIPDVGTLYTVSKMKSDKKDITYYLKSRGTISGGTWASFINALYSNKPIIGRGSKSGSGKKIKKIFYNKDFKSWSIIFPVIDKQIVYRSSKTDNIYGNNFSFNEYMMIKTFFQVIVLMLSILSITFISKLGLLKKQLLSLRPSGSGPSIEQRKRNWFKGIFVGVGDNEKVVTQLSGGDPGYGETAKFISEIALCIINDYDNLKGKAGIMTPVECTGDLMINRLENAGIKFEQL